MTNYEWLLNMGCEERQAWFDAEHEANDTLSAENGVSAGSVDANGANVAQDSREKLEADIDDYLESEYGIVPGVVAMIPEWLDRQAAITERELCKQCDWPSLAAQPDLESQDRIAELTAKLEREKKHREYAYKEANKFINVNGKLAKNVRLLTTRVDELTSEREQYRELLSKAITHAHEIVNLQP